MVRAWDDVFRNVFKLTYFLAFNAYAVQIFNRLRLLCDSIKIKSNINDHLSRIREECVDEYQINCSIIIVFSFVLHSRLFINFKTFPFHHILLEVVLLTENTSLTFGVHSFLWTTGFAVASTADDSGSRQRSLICRFYNILIWV